MRDEGGVAPALEKKIYSGPALVPAYPWLSQAVPALPLLSVQSEGGELKLEWKSSGSAPWQWVVQKKIDGKWTAEILPEEKTSETIKSDFPESVSVTAVNRYGNLSLPAIYHAAR
jgi:hypothetical protein